MHFGLEKMGRLMALLGSPHEGFASIHVVGTNGKSSTTRMIAAILERHGVRTGSYTSPHLVSFTERIQVGERDLSDERFGRAVERVARAAAVVDQLRPAGGADEGRDPVTQFEALTGAAYAELDGAGVEVAVIEAGLGGRYDATSVIESKVAVLTNIGLEHTAWLGDTIAEIAAEKLAVVPAGGVLVLGGCLHPDALAVARGVADERGARIVEAAVALAPEISLRARGSYQRRNFAVAIAAAEAYLASPLDPEAVRRAAGELLVAGRFEVLERQTPPTGGGPPPADRTTRIGDGRSGAVTLLDGAHNPAGIEALVESLAEFLAGRRLCAVVSVLEDKDARSMLAALLPVCDRVICTAASNPRALPADILGETAGEVASTTVGGAGVGWNATAGAVEVEVEADPGRAVALGRLREPDGVVLVTGSIYLISDVVRGPRRGSTL
jgi:dihydrofolate synthase/folylpolyglutamate synthase